MKTIQLNLSCDTLCMVNDHFITSPYLVQAAFVLTRIENINHKTIIHCEDFIYLSDNECEYISSELLEISADAVIRILKAAKTKQQSFLYMRTHPDVQRKAFSPSADEKTLFRIAYAYNPFGQHLITYIDRQRMSAYAVLPNLSYSPVEIILPANQPIHQRLCIK